MEGGGESAVAEGAVGGGKNNFLDVLNSESRLEAFKLFLRRSHCSESLTFYMDIQQYRKVNDDTERAQLAANIYQTYFGDDTDGACGVAVNVSAACARRVGEALRQRSVTNADTTVFDEAQLEVFQMLRFDLLPRFLRQEFQHQPESEGLDSVCSERLAHSNVANKRSGCSPIATAQPRRSILRLLRDVLAFGGVPSLLGGSNLLTAPSSANRSASVPHEAEASVPPPSSSMRRPRTRASAEHASTIAAAMAMMNGCRNFGGTTTPLRHSYSFTQRSMEADDDASLSSSASLADDDVPTMSLKSGNSFYGSSIEKAVVAVEENNDNASRLRRNRDKTMVSAADEGGEIQRVDMGVSTSASSSADEASDFDSRGMRCSRKSLSTKTIADVPFLTIGGYQKARASMEGHHHVKCRNNDDADCCKYDYNDFENCGVGRSVRQPLSSLLPSPLLTRRGGPQTSRSRFSEAALLGHQQRHTATTATDSLAMMKMATALRHRQQQQKHQQQLQSNRE